ncbi:MAG TPA: bifunctional diguanylate cyclase/phosphodiesterase [Gammaproteobacteria bacterium]|nr:bifunctional diguanylate cyclase/phosphodiesterase [Gammaproteobacteria bacterium]
MGDAYHVTCLMLLGLGAAVMTAAFFPVRGICMDARAHSQAWVGLPALIIFFTLGYVASAFALAWQNKADLRDLWVATALFGAACFMWGITQVSWLIIRETQRIAALEHHRAAHDPLTTLPNRVFFIRQLEDAIARTAEQNRLAVLIMDLDRFKLINDTLGHQYGDILLQEVSLRVHASLRVTDLVARLGGDEFGILINPVDDPEHLKTIARHVATVLEGPFAVNGHLTDVGASIGVAYYPEHGAGSNALMKNAEIAMYEAKRRGADVMVYDAGFDTNDLDRLNILSELRQAIDQAHLLVHYQPQFAANSGRLTGVEALVRWPHPRFGLLLPEEFIALAERSGLINRLNRWMLDNVFEQLTAWRMAGIEIPISTNVSVVNLEDPDLFEYIVEGLRVRGLAARQLKLEVTETAVMSDPKSALAAVKRLSELGVRFSIDDFGTGYSSLIYLREMPIDEIKIDRSFIVNMTRDNNDAIIVRSTIDLAHNMGRLVTAEGVENRAVVELLRQWNCDTLQGFYLSPPLTAEALNLKLNNSSWSPAFPLHAN